MDRSTRITDEGQVTIPTELREKYGLELGDEVIWTDTDEGIVVRKRTHTDGRGLLVPEDTTVKTRTAIAEELRRRVRERRDHNYI